MKDLEETFHNNSMVPRTTSAEWHCGDIAALKMAWTLHPLVASLQKRFCDSGTQTLSTWKHTCTSSIALVYLQAFFALSPSSWGDFLGCLVTKRLSILYTYLWYTLQEILRDSWKMDGTQDMLKVTPLYQNGIIVTIWFCLLCQQCNQILCSVYMQMNVHWWVYVLFHAQCSAGQQTEVWWNVAHYCCLVCGNLPCYYLIGGTNPCASFLNSD